MANIKARRKLSDLYKTGVEVRFGPGGPQIGKEPDGKIGGLIRDADGKEIPPGAEDIQMWIQPPNPLHRDMAMRDAQASRAKALVRAKRDEESEEHLTVMAFLADMSDETLLEYCLIQQQDEFRQDAIREVLGQDEWEDMQSYQDAIRQYEESELSQEELEKDEEWVALNELDIKFGKQVGDREREIRDAARSGLQIQLSSGRGNLERKALKFRSDQVGTQAFMHRYEQEMLFYSVRDFEDNGVLFYGSSREFQGEHDEIKATVAAALAPFISESAEAKNWQGVVSGLGSSEPPKEQETSGASTPEDANA